MPNSDNKNSLRKHFRRLRNQIDENDTHTASIKLCDEFLSQIDIKKTDIVSTYYPVSSEISCIDLVKKLNDMGIKTALPLIKKTDFPLVFKEWVLGDELVFNDRFKIYEPKEGQSDVVPNIIITPALAFDNDGYRLGYGGGYYDRTIADLKHKEIAFKAVGVGYALQKCEKLPIGKYDEKVDLVILV